MTWQPALGAIPDARGTRFRVWAPAARAVTLALEGGGSTPLDRGADGYFEADLPGIGAGVRYRYRVDGAGPFPDPASRYQPEGVHGPSQVVDPRRFAWTDQGWRGVAYDDLTIYELHVGTFTPEGTFAAAAGRLPALKDLGITALELMPVADFPGQRNWGYDGVAPFAPARCYGTPDDLRRLVDEAHRLGLAVLLDVVFNHLGPDGNYLGEFSPYYFSTSRRTPWGPALNFDGTFSGPVRAYLVENALHWVHEYHLDGFRFDATHAVVDDSPRHIIAELSARVRASVLDRPIHLIAEDPRNLADLVRPEAEGGWGLDGVWSDDFHHELRRFLVGDHEGVFADHRGTIADVSRAINTGWIFCGEFSKYRGYHRGTDPRGIPPRRFVFCLQNHDRIGNRAFGERLHHQIDPAQYRAATALLFVGPATPLLFMGQEWAASTPFLFFTDHRPELARQVRAGRRREFRQYAEFADPAVYARVPDLQDTATFRSCQLRWDEREHEPHAAMLRLYRTLLALRRSEPSLKVTRCGCVRATPLDHATLLVRRDADDGPPLVLIARLKGAGTVAPGEHLDGADRPWECILTTEDPPFAPDASPPRIDSAAPGLVIMFSRPGAVLLRGRTAR